MKCKSTKKAIMEGYRYTIEIGYCDLQFALDYIDPIAYTAGVNGWNADIYQINHSTAIVTGYNPFGNIHPDYKIVQECDSKAREIERNSDHLTGLEVQGEIEKLLREFCTEVITEHKKKVDELSKSIREALNKTAEEIKNNAKVEDFKRVS